MRLPPGFFATLALVIFGTPTRAFGASKPMQPGAGGSLSLFCSLDRPVITPEDSVKVSVISPAQRDAVVDYSWTAEDGRFLVSGREPALQASGSEVIWTAKGVSPGIHKLSLTARDASGAMASCSLSVIVSPAERGAGKPSIRDLARAFLPRDVLESRNYGLYSYVLLPNDCSSSQSGTIRQRCELLIRQALVQILEEKEMRAVKTDTSTLDLTYLLVTHDIPADLVFDRDKHLDEQVYWILANYDYARCHRLLDLLHETVTRPGPFIVSSNLPVFRSNEARSSSNSPVKPQCIVQDFSDVPLNVMPVWLHRFQNQIFQEEFWKQNAFESFAWDLRKYLAIAAIGLPDVQAAVKVIGAGSK